MNQLVSWTKTIDSRTNSASTRFFIRYALFIGITKLVWESLDLPLYTLWIEGEPGDLVFAVVHCTAGDVMIAFATLGIALLLVGSICLCPVFMMRISIRCP